MYCQTYSSFKKLQLAVKTKIPVSCSVNLNPIYPIFSMMFMSGVPPKFEMALFWQNSFHTQPKMQSAL